MHSQELKEFKRLYHFLTDASSSDLYKWTEKKCYYKCTYPVSDLKIRLSVTAYAKAAFSFKTSATNI